MFAEDTYRYQRIAELVLRFRLDDANTLHRRHLHRDPKTVAHVWRSLDDSSPKTYEMMAIFGVKSRTTMTAAVKRAVKAGELDESELTGRNRPRSHQFSSRVTPTV